MQILTDQDYNIKMRELGLIEDLDYGKYFLGDMAFLMNVGDNVTNLGNLLQLNDSNHLTYISKVLTDFSLLGAKLTIGPGAIDEYGVKCKNGLYCLNYKEIFPKKENIIKIK